MTNLNDAAGYRDRFAVDLRIGAPEREAAREALGEHLAAARLDEGEYEQRLAACLTARTESELLQVFADLPVPHPELSGSTTSAADDDDDVTALGWAVGLTLVLGLPVTVVLGFAYGTWWSLTVPVALAVVMMYTEHLLTRVRDQQPVPDQTGTAAPSP